jgi:hypothetical protein
VNQNTGVWQLSEKHRPRLSTRAISTPPEEHHPAAH